MANGCKLDLLIGERRKCPAIYAVNGVDKPVHCLMENQRRLVDRRVPYAQSIVVSTRPLMGWGANLDAIDAVFRHPVVVRVPVPVKMPPSCVKSLLIVDVVATENVPAEICRAASLETDWMVTSRLDVIVKLLGLAVCDFGIMRSLSARLGQSSC